MYVSSHLISLLSLTSLLSRLAAFAQADGDLTKGWAPIPGVVNPSLNGGPSLRWNPLDSMYYAILGGHHVELFRTREPPCLPILAIFVTVGL